MGRREGLLVEFTPEEKIRIWDAARRYDLGELNDRELNDGLKQDQRQVFAKWLVDHRKLSDFPDIHATHTQLQRAPNLLPPTKQPLVQQGPTTIFQRGDTVTSR